MIYMTIRCPLDGDLLTTVSPQDLPLEQVHGDFEADATQHVHIPLFIEMQCSNGHRWQIDAPDLVLTRLPEV